MDDDLLPISALQHLAFCEQYCVLIHVERQWEENQRTAEGRVLHEHIDEGYRTYQRGMKQFAGVYVQGQQLGIAGRRDVLELVRKADAPDTCRSLGISGCWELHPVESRRSKPTQHDANRVQPCAQALCLEAAPAAFSRDGRVQPRAMCCCDDDSIARATRSPARLRSRAVTWQRRLRISATACFAS